MTYTLQTGANNLLDGIFGELDGASAVTGPTPVDLELNVAGATGPTLPDWNGGFMSVGVFGAPGGPLTNFVGQFRAAGPSFAQNSSTFSSFNAAGYGSPTFGNIQAPVAASPALGDLNDEGLLNLMASNGDGGPGLIVATAPPVELPVEPRPNTRPVAGNDFFTIFKSGVLTGNLLAANPTIADSDADGDTLSVVTGSEGREVALGNGLLNVQSNGSFVFNPNGGYDALPSGVSSIVRFGYMLSDGRGGADTAMVTITISGTPPNQAPITSPVPLEPMPEDGGPLTITQAMLLVNAQDPDGDALTVTNLSIDKGSNGNLVNNLDGTWSYTPAPNDDTGVNFFYTISDGTANVGTSATLDITPVNDAPVARDDSAQTALNTPVSIDVVANDTDVDSTVLRVSVVNPGANGSTAIGSGSSVRYTPDTGFSGFDTFTYTVRDGVGSNATASVRVVVASATGSNGNDTTLGTQQADFVLGLDGADRILTHGGDDYVDGGRGADTITGGAGADTLMGGDGPDTFLASSSELAGDHIDGGDGNDVLVITNAPASLPANFSFTNLEQISFTGGLLVPHTSLLDLSSLTLASGSSNNITGGTANSRITGTASADNIVDSAGNDNLNGAGGNDTVMGGFGQDTINGGTGNDVLYGGSATTANDFVRDIFGLS